MSMNSETIAELTRQREGGSSRLDWVRDNFGGISCGAGRGLARLPGALNPRCCASHIWPWRELSNEERLDPANGILLAANLDALFDRFLISFHEDGHMLISDRVQQSCRELFGFPARLRGELTAEEKGFLGHHREQFQEEEYRLAAGTTVLPTRVS